MSESKRDSERKREREREKDRVREREREGRRQRQSNGTAGYPREPEALDSLVHRTGRGRQNAR